MKRYTSFLASAAVAAVFLVPAFAFAADPNWTLNAPSNIDFSCGGTYSHTLGTVFQDINGNLTGTGYYNTDPSYTWNLTGVISGNTINFTILYTSAAAGSTYNSVGTINPDGSITGTTDGNCSAFSMAAGSASPVSMVSCPVGTVQTLLETIPVNSASIGGANSVASLAAGQSYIFSASDTWNNRSG